MISPENHPQDTSALDYKYPGTENLVLIETALTNYNEWIVDKFIRAFTERNDQTARVLDFGSGLGTLSKIFYERTGIRPDTFDIDAAHRVDIAKSGFHAYGNVEDLPKGYDLVFSSNVLEHIEDDFGIMKAIHLHLRPNGTLLVYVPAFEFLWTSMDDVVKHVRRYSRKELCDKLRAAGYEIEYVGYCDSIGFILSLLFKLIGRKGGEMPLRSLYFYDRVLLPVTKIIDRVAAHFFGKNLYVIARKSG